MKFKFASILKIVCIVIIATLTLTASLIIIYDKLANWTGESDSYCNVARLDVADEITTSSSDDFLSRLKTAQENDQVKAIFVSFDSQGGSLSGGEAIRSALASSTKPIISYVRDSCYSSCFLALTGIKQINLGPYSDVGGIGVIMEHYDNTVKNQKDGVAYDAITTGKYKNIATPDRKMTADERAVLQDQTNYLGNIFFNQIKASRNLSDEQMAKIKDADTYNGQRAIDAGLADQILSWPEVIEKVKTETGDDQVEWCQ